MSFINKFISNGDISFSGLRNVAVEALSNFTKIQLDKLYDDLDRGTGVLDDEDHLNMYLRSYGRMHREKLKEAFSCIPSMLNLNESEIEVYDWGCGQGTATICLLDYITENAPNHAIKRISLIDPSKAATARAESVIKCYGIAKNVDIRIVTKGFDELFEKDIESENAVKLHLFSNILDVTLFDLSAFTNLFQKTFNSGDNHFICVGPYYYNNRRVDDFMVAIDPDTVTSSYYKQKGEWRNDWTISLRMFSKKFVEIEKVSTIRKRIIEAKKQQQFHAGYILDEVSQSFSELNEDRQLKAETLVNSLCAFDVRASEPLEYSEKIDSIWAVLHNIVVRGNPTIAPLMIQELFRKKFGFSYEPDSNNPAILYQMKGIDADYVYKALHAIDPRFSIENYNGDMLESDFERSFIEQRLKGSSSEHLIQLLEPQRQLSTIVKVPDRTFTKDRRVDFALELPCSEPDKNPVGFIIEIDGAPYHSNIFQRRNDERRDIAAAQNNWDTYRLTESPDNRFVKNWEDETSLVEFLKLIKENYKRKIEGKWATYLQLVLSPLAVARVEKVIIQAVLSGIIDPSEKKWKLAVIERDVPCARIAVEHLRQMHSHICALAGENPHFPEVELDVITSNEFKDSPLHEGNKVQTSIPNKKFDICIDISMLLRDKIDALPNQTEAKAYYLVRTSHYKKCERFICCAESIKYRPLVEKNSKGEYAELEQPKEHLTYFLQEIFRKRGFRKGQLPILSRSLSNKTTIGLLPTGGGKSLTYQLSSMMQPGVTIVVDPLISLMVDQYRGLNDIRIDASACVNSTMKREEKTRNLNLMQNGALTFIFLSPERFMMEDFRTNLLTMSRRNHVYFSYGVIDEVHCVSEWGHDFRTSYLHLGRNMTKFLLTKSGEPVPVTGLTATASFDVLADVERELTLGGNLTLDSEAIVRPESDTRPELTYKIIGVETDFSPLKDEQHPYRLNIQSDWSIKELVSESKRRAISELLPHIPEDIEYINNHKNNGCQIENFNIDSFYEPDETDHYNNAGILFCPHARGGFGVEDTEYKNNHPGLVSYLYANENERFNIGSFIGGDKPSGDMATFNCNEQNIMVATKAFGMGIDKPNIRYTINLNHPSSIESYVQEAGRAGRDRKNAISYLLYDNSEYINLSMDKINDITTKALGLNNFPNWLYDIKDTYTLKSDLINYLVYNGANIQQAQIVYDFCVDNMYFENADKEIQLYFHNNSFRGLYKEKVILNEMTDRILNTKPKNLLNIQGMVRDYLGDNDIILELRENYNGLVVKSEEEPDKQYGFIFLDSLNPSFRFIKFDRDICNKVINGVISVLEQLSENQRTFAWLNSVIDGAEIEEEGIYSAMKSMQDSDEYVYVTVTWDNQIKQDQEDFENNVKEKIKEIAEKEGWNNIDEQHYGKINFSKIKDFDELINKIYKCSRDIKWLTYHNQEQKYRPLKKAFCRKRDKSDTDKAIYRMCCVGLVDDVTIDYNLETYQLKIKKRTDEEYLGCMLDFFKKYYSAEQAEEKVNELKSHNGRNTLDRCLGYLTDFVYQNLERKRFRSIDDMRLACQDGITRGEDWLKEFIHLYFNSKYARDDYRVGDKDYSLKKDTDRNREDFEVVKKYIDIVFNDNTGSEINNVKHLYGATLLVLRAHPDNAALNLLRTYCIAFLGAGDNETLMHESLTGYVEGFSKLYRQKINNLSEMIGIMDEFNEALKKIVHEEDSYIKEHVIEEGKEIVLLNIHNNWLNDFSNKYCK